MIEREDEGMREFETFREYRNEVVKFIDPAQEKETTLLMCECGLFGESGELVDCFKKEIYHGRPVERANFVNEAGDVWWYLIAAAHCEGYDMDELMGFTSIEAFEKRARLMMMNQRLGFIQIVSRLKVSCISSDVLGLRMTGASVVMLLALKNISLVEVLGHNIDKLSARYSERLAAWEEVNHA